MVSEIQTMRKLNNPTATSFAGFFLTVVQLIVVQVMQLPFWQKISLGARLPSHLDNGLSHPHFQGFFSPQQ